MRNALPILALLLPLATPATERSELDQVLQGFGDAPAADTSLDAVLQGFDDGTAPADTTVDETRATQPLPWRISGVLSFSTTYNYAHDAPAPNQTDYRGLSRFRGKLNLELDADLATDWRLHATGHGFHDLAYQLNGRNHYRSEVLDSLEDEAELDEAWLQGRLVPSVDLKLGRQIVVWGKSDNLRVTDVLNPLDSREMGLVDIEDLRLPLTMSRIDWYSGDWNASVIAIHEIRFNKLPPYGSDFYPAPVAPQPELLPGNGGGNTEYALAVSGLFSGWDLAFYGASLLDDQPHMETGILHHNRIGMAGTALNIASGNWLWKGEAAHFSGLRFSSLNGERSRSDLLLGAEYSGLRDTTLSLEVVNRHLHDWQPALTTDGQVENDLQWALRYQGDFLHARLKLTALGVQSGAQLERGGFTRLEARYELATATTLGGGVVMYKPGSKPPFHALGDNDRLFLDLKYSF